MYIAWGRLDYGVMRGLFSECFMNNGTNKVRDEPPCRVLRYLPSTRNVKADARFSSSRPQERTASIAHACVADELCSQKRRAIGTASPMTENACEASDDLRNGGIGLGVTAAASAMQLVGKSGSFERQARRNSERNWIGVAGYDAFVGGMRG